ncbi:MAG: hypothetical protein EKK48_10490 [Candidatus Melainabacteria bacterium]|nr:MAG: hypothetical protein EKK48_10490 [Candidatus Melainabacteria bacterium]
MNKSESKLISIFVMCGAFAGLLCSTIFALNPILQLGLYKIHHFDLLGTTAASQQLASELVGKAQFLVVLQAVLDHGLLCMMSGGFLSLTLFLAVRWFNKYLIEGSTGAG